MILSEGKKKDLILKYIVERYAERIGSSSEEIQKNVLPYSSIEDINFLLKEIENHETELIKMYFGSSTSYVTKVTFAKPFLDRGGFERIENKQNRQNRKDFLDFNVSKFKYYTFWPIFIFAFVGFGFSVYNFMNSRENLENTKLQKERIDKMESELIKLQTSISIQKNLDSLRYSKVLTKKIEKDSE